MISFQQPFVAEWSTFRLFNPDIKGLISILGFTFNIFLMAFFFVLNVTLYVLNIYKNIFTSLHYERNVFRRVHVGFHKVSNTSSGYVKIKT